MTLLPSFIAELHYRSTNEGGRKTPAHSGYRPAVKFPFSNMQTSGQQIFIDRDVVYPGEQVVAEITILAVPYFAGTLKVGLEFDFREGPTIIGTGKIITILDEELLAKD